MLPEELFRLSQRFSRLPGVGEKTALRYAMFLLLADPAIARGLGQELIALHDNVTPCERCGYVARRSTEGPSLCAICSDHRRDPSLLCVVARVQDLLAIERSGAMRGRYHVLGKLLSPLEGVHASDLPLASIRSRIQNEGIREVLLATPPTVDGEASALFIAQEIGDLEVRISRLASGVPHGGDLEFADQITLGRAIDGRHQVVHDFSEKVVSK
ncbi:MAG TPA: recombination mediator RecR [Polyangiaceae bacterium]|nr:recombination mediator RecR [Polyangiaceae bacterium]